MDQRDGPEELERIARAGLDPAEPDSNDLDFRLTAWNVPDHSMDDDLMDDDGWGDGAWGDGDDHDWVDRRYGDPDGSPARPVWE